MQVLAMSAWYAQETYTNGKPQGSQTGMSWLDGVNNWGKFIEAGPCHETTSDDGTHYATFSNIRFGDIGTTTSGSGASAATTTPGDGRQRCWSQTTRPRRGGWRCRR